MSGAIGSFAIGISAIAQFGQIGGWAGYSSAPIVVLSTEMDGLASSSGDVLAVSSPLVNSLGAPLADIELAIGGACSPVTDAFVEIWILRSIDGGSKFEDGGATVAPARPPDATMAVVSGTNVVPRAGEPALVLPPGSYKIALRNQMGVPIPAGSILRLAPYGESPSGGAVTLPGDATGTTAYRIGDVLERFGVVTYSQTSLSVNPWGAGTSDYTAYSVVTAINWITANSGLTMNVREYHVAGRDTGGGSDQLDWCPTVFDATGARFDVSLQRGAGTSDATSLANMAASSANTTGWMAWAEGLNTPNDGSVTAANCVTIQQTLNTGVAATSTMTFPVSCVGPSLTYATVPPETSTAISTYLTAQQKSDLLAASPMASVRFFPTANPEANDSAGRGGNLDDVALGHTIFFGKPQILGEFHPTQSNADSPSRASDDSFGAYYGVLMMLNAHRLGFEAWFWKSLFDIGRSGESPWVRVGLFPNSGSDIPRLPARAIRAMYALTGDPGSSKRTFLPSKLDYSISGLPAPPASATPWMGGHHRLFQNSGGTFFLFVWNEQFYPGGSGTTVTIKFARPMASVTHYDLTTDATTAETPVASLTNTSSLSFSLTASVHLFVIYPQGSIIPTESTQDTTLTSTAGVIYDSFGVAWTLVSNPPFGLQVSHQGMLDSQNIVLLLYHDHIVHQQNNVGQWAYWNNATSAWVAEPRDPRVTLTETADSTIVNTTGQTIYASQTPGQPAGSTLDAWTLTTGAQAAKNGTPDPAATNAIELYYHNHFVFLEQTTGNSFGTPGWKFYNGTGWTDCANPFGIVESAEGAQVSTVGPTINASATPGVASTTLHVFALVPGTGGAQNYQITFDGTLDAETGGVDLLYYHNHTLFQRVPNFTNSFGSPAWWVWNGPTMTDWADSPSPLSSTGPTETTDGTTVTSPGVIIYASQTPGQPPAPGSALDQWALTSGQQITLNGAVRTDTSGVLSLYYANHFLYQSANNANSLGFNPGWWRWNGSGWTDVAPPTQVGTPTIVITNIPQQVVGQSFTVTGTLSGYSSAPSLQYRDGNGNWTALPVGAVVSATAFAFTHPAITSSATTAPAPAAAVGYNTLTHGPNVTLNQNWWGLGASASAMRQNADGSVTDLGIPQANGVNAHLTPFIGDANGGDGGNYTGVGFGGGGYFEATLQFSGPWPIDMTDGWPAWWSMTIEADNQFFNGITPLPNSNNIEVDQMEFFGDSSTSFNSGIICWYGNGGNFNNNNVGFSGVAQVPNGANMTTARHKIGWLWVPATPTTQGYAKTFFDGIQTGFTYTWNRYNGGTVPGTANEDSFSIIDVSHRRLWLGGGSVSQVTVYAVEVWQKDDSQNIRVGVPLPSSSSGPTTISVRDAGNTSVQATSNTFNVAATGSVVLSDIVLSNNTLITASPAGTQIGTLFAVISGGTFTGSFSVNDTTHFRIAGSTLQNNTTLAAGNYPISVTATMAGASGSPLTRNFTISVSTSGNTSINFSAPTGRTMNKSLWGFTSSTFGGDFSNATFRSTANTFLKPAALCINADWDLDTKFANGQMTDINNLLNFYRSFCQTGVRVIMGCAYKTSAGSASTLASRAANFARYLNANGFSDILDWNVGNMWGDHGGDGLPQSTVISYFNAIADALHGVNPAYKVWGPAQWDPGFFANATWGNQVGTRCGGVPWMSYDVNPTSGTVGVPMTDSLATAYGTKAISNPDASNQRNALAGTPLANVGIGTFDHNMSEYANETGTYVGGIYNALYTLGAFLSASNVDVMCVQNIGPMGVVGAIGGPSQGGNLSAVTCFGYVFGKAGQTMFGPEYTSSTSIANLAMVAVKPSSTTFAIMLVNYHLTNSQTISLTVTGGVPSGTITRWEIGKSSPGGPTSPVPTTSTQTSLSSVTVPSETVVILTGQLA